jgi:nitroimidazol reductase NimA-like FMN-containing flavoprotein (pyridoxamine 5'-phosphate oxidase superfamily)
MTHSPTPRAQVKRLPQRASYDPQQVYDILDEGLVCHLGFVVEGQPFVIPTAYGRLADQLYIHGSPASRMLRTLDQGVEVCLTVTLLDGLVLARSAFHHSMNYRSVVLFGTATRVDDPSEKLTALKAFTDHVVCDRWAEVRPPTPRNWPVPWCWPCPLPRPRPRCVPARPIDAAEDYALPVWAGKFRSRLSPPPPSPMLSAHQI